MTPGTLIRYGSNEYDHTMYPIRNDWVKPKGGLWTSPVNSDWGWKQWCESNEFRLESLQYSYKLELLDNARLLIIDSLDDLLRLPFRNDLPIHQIISSKYLDFELLKKSYDAIWLTKKGQGETHLSRPINLYGWDCECVLIMNKKCFKVLDDLLV